VSPSEPTPWTIEEQGDVRSIVGRHFVLAFTRVGDRWTHQILLSRLSGGPRELVARSQEWDTERDDPSRVISPVFQEMHIQLDAMGRPQTLLLGMSGRHHFSAAFLLAEIEGRIALSIDVADRSPSNGAASLASTYMVVTPSSRLVSGDASCIVWDYKTHRLSFEAGPSTRLSLAEAGGQATRVQALAEPGAIAPTRRWRYSWSLSPIQPEPSPGARNIDGKTQESPHGPPQAP
jgi:hypothetical protein